MGNPTMHILSFITVFFSTLLSPSLLAPQKMDFKTVCKNGCPAIIMGASGRSFSKQKSEPKAEPEPEPVSKPMSIPEIVSTNSDFSTLGITAVETLGGEEVEVIRAGSCVSLRSGAGTADVVTADVVATNGVVHVVDSVF